MVFNYIAIGIIAAFMCMVIYVLINAPKKYSYEKAKKMINMLLAMIISAGVVKLLINIYIWTYEK